MPGMPGPVELVVILVIVAMLFGVGKLPEVFGSVGKGIREFRRNTSDPVAPKHEESSEEASADTQDESKRVSV